MEFEKEMLALVPQMRAFARMLLRDRQDADDLVQDAILRMWQAQERFVPGTNLRAWAFTIIRNRFYNAFVPRAAFRSIDDVEQSALATGPLQQRHIEGCEIRRALAALDPSLREVLVLMAGSGMSVAEVAAIIGCPEGTVKSRAFRARRVLRDLLEHYPHLQTIPARSALADSATPKATGRCSTAQ